MVGWFCPYDSGEHPIMSNGSVPDTKLGEAESGLQIPSERWKRSGALGERSQRSFCYDRITYGHRGFSLAALGTEEYNA
jgi:hypothetical protein